MSALFKGSVGTFPAFLCVLMSQRSFEFEICYELTFALLEFSFTVERHKRMFSTFLECDEYKEQFDEKIKQAINSKKCRIIFNINEL